MSILQSIKNLFTRNKAPAQSTNNPLTGRPLPSSQIQQTPRVQVPQAPRIQPTSPAVQAGVAARPAAKQLFNTIASFSAEKPQRTFTENLAQAPKATIIDPVKGGVNMGARVLTGLTNVLNTPRRTATNLVLGGAEKLTGVELPRSRPMPLTDVFTPKTKEEALGMSAGAAASYLVPGTGAARLTTGASLPTRIGAQFAADLGTDALAFGEITPTGVGASLFGALAEAALPGRVPTVQNLQVPTRAPVSPVRPQVTPQPVPQAVQPTRLQPATQSPQALPQIQPDVLPTNINERLTLRDRFLKLTETQGRQVEKLSEQVPTASEITPVERKSLNIQRVENVSERIVKDFEDIVQNKIGDLKLVKPTQDYAIARTRIDRGAGDIATPEELANARKFLEDYEKLDPETKLRMEDGRKALVNESTKTYEMLYRAGLVPEETFIRNRTNLPEHVNLFRKLQEAEDRVFLGSKGKGVKGAGIFKAKGSDLEVDDVIGNLITARIQAESKIANNEVLRDVANLANQIEELGLSQSTVKVVDALPSGKRFDETILLDTKPLDDRFVPFVNTEGKVKLLEFNSPVEAQFWSKLNSPSLAFNSALANQVLNGLKFLTRNFGVLYTKFSPTFQGLSNVMDIQEMAADMITKGQDLKSIGKFIGSEPANKKAMANFLAGKKTPETEEIQKLVDNGVISMSYKLMDKDEARKVGELLATKGVAKSKIDKILGSFDKFGMFFDGSTKYGLYKVYKQQGVSDLKAMAMAKRTGIDYSISGELGPIVKPFIVFGDTSLKGMARSLKNLSNPKTFAAISAALTTGIIGAREWNEFVDSIDPDNNIKFSEWDRLNSVPIKVPFTEKYIPMPVTHGFRPLKVALETGINEMYGETQDPVERSKALIKSIFSNVVPSTTTIADPFLDVAKNETFTGGQIRPGYEPGDYFASTRDTQMGRFLIGATEKIDELSKGTIRISPNDIQYLARQFTGAPGGALTGVIDSIVSASEGEFELPRNRFLKESASEFGEVSELDRAASREAELEARIEKRQANKTVINLAKNYSKLKDSDNLAKKEEFNAKIDELTDDEYTDYLELISKSEAEDLVDKYKKLSKSKDQAAKEEFNATIDSLDDATYELYIEELATEKLSRAERQLKNKEVAVRAKYIANKKAEMKPDEFNTYLDTLEQAGILTESVQEYLFDNYNL